MTVPVLNIAILESKLQMKYFNSFFFLEILTFGKGYFGLSIIRGLNEAPNKKKISKKKSNYFVMVALSTIVFQYCSSLV